MTPTVAVSLIVIADSRVEGEESLGDGAHDSTEIYEELKRLGIKTVGKPKGKV